MVQTSISATPGVVHRIEVRLAGPSIEVWWDGARQIHVADMFSITATKHGLFWSTVWDWLSTFDNFTVTGSLPCVTWLSPASFTAPAESGFGSVTISAPANCSWHASVDSPWVTLLSPATGTGPATLTYSVAANTTAPMAGGSPRGATIVVDGRATTILQAPMPDPCSVSVSSGDSSFTADGGPRSFFVSATLPICAWTVTTDADWITIVDRTGAGGAAPRYGVAPNPTTEARAGSITVNGYPFNVSQFAGPSTGGGGGGSCVGGVFPSASSWAGDGGQGSITVSALGVDRSG